MKTNYFFTVLLFFYCSFLQAQIVETLTYNSKIKDGMYVDANGHVYTTSGGLQNGFEIGKYDIDTETFTYDYFTGFFGPIDIDEKSNGDYVVTNYDNNTVVTLNTSTNQITQIASGLDGPACIAIGEDDTIYISNFGAPPLYAGHQIHKISPEGQISVLADSPLLYRFQAIVLNGEGELIVSSRNELYKVDLITGELELWVDLETFGFGHMIYRSLDNSIYGAATGEHKIFKVNAQGEVSVFAGSVAGIQDGDLETALFNAPFGLEISPNENIIYVGDTNRLRRIIIDEELDVTNNSHANFTIYPNPSPNGIINIQSNDSNKYTIELYDLAGKLLQTNKIVQQQYQLDYSRFSKGFYFLKVTNTKGSQAFKISIK